MAAVSLVKGRDPKEKWAKILAYYSRFAGETLPFNEEVYRSEADTTACPSAAPALRYCPRRW